MYRPRCRRWGTSGAGRFIEARPSIAQRRLRRHNFRGGTLSGKLGGGEFVGCLTVHPSSQRVNVNRQGEGLSCGGESIITEEGHYPTECPEWVEGVGEPGDRGMSMSAAGCACESPCNASTVGGVCEGSPSSWPARASPFRGVCDGLIIGAPPITAQGRRWGWRGRGVISSQLRWGSTNFTFSRLATRSLPLCCWRSHRTGPRTHTTSHCGSQRLVNVNRSSGLSKTVSPTWISFASARFANCCLLYLRLSAMAWRAVWRADDKLSRRLLKWLAVRGCNSRVSGVRTRRP